MERRAQWPELLLLAASPLACLLAFELALRLALPVPELDDGRRPERFHALRYAESAMSRHALEPGPLTVDVPWGNHYRINSKGYRGDEFAWTKPEGTRRIAVYGGSAVFDIYQDEGEDWPARLGRELRASGPGAVEVINAGVPGHASFDSLGRLLGEGHRLGADVVLFYHAWNDLTYFADAAPILRKIRPLRVEEGLWRPRGRLDAALAHSHAYRFLRVRFLMWDRRLGIQGRLPDRPLRTGFAREQLDQFRLNTRSFVDLVRNAGARPVLVTQPLLVAAANSDEERATIQYRYAGLDHDTLVEAYGQLTETVRQVARSEGAALVDAAAEMAGVGRYFLDEVHLSSEGSAALAARLARELAPILDGPPPG